jgi:hypothetical protein
MRYRSLLACCVCLLALCLALPALGSPACEPAACAPACEPAAPACEPAACEPALVLAESTVCLAPARHAGKAPARAVVRGAVRLSAKVVRRVVPPYPRLHARRASCCQ